MQHKFISIINNFNILSWTKNLADFIAKENRVHVVIVDNNSTYKPLLDWYDICPYEVVRLKENRGAHGGFCAGPPDNKEMYIYTDPDLDLSSIPANWLNVLLDGCLKHNAFKCGFSLEIKDLPNDYPLKEKTVNWERNFWKSFSDERYNVAAIDTTFSLINPLGNKSLMLRTARPYTAKHMPWYITDSNMSEEYKNYLNTINRSTTHYSRWLIEKMESDKIKDVNIDDFIGVWFTSLGVNMTLSRDGSALWNNSITGSWIVKTLNSIEVSWATGSVDLLSLTAAHLQSNKSWIASRAKW